LQGDGDLACRHLAAGHVHHGDQANKSTGHRAVGRIDCTDVVDLSDCELAQRLGVDLVAGAGSTTSPS
jgi:hypothetical protein